MCLYTREFPIADLDIYILFYFLTFLQESLARRERERVLINNSEIESDSRARGKRDQFSAY